MCGIIAIVRSRARRGTPERGEILDLLDPVPALLEGAAGDGDLGALAPALHRAADAVAAVDRLLRGSPGVQALVTDRSLLAAVDNATAGLTAQIDQIEGRLDARADRGAAELEVI